MNLWLPRFNFFGVVLLAVLCGLQWQRNRGVNLQVEALTRKGWDQAAKLSEQDRAVKACTADLESFRTQLANNHATVQQIETKANEAARAMAQVSGERDQLKANVTNWSTAVASRDEQLRELGERLHKTAEERNQLATKWNGLGEKHNALVKELDERTQQLNVLLSQQRRTATKGGAGVTQDADERLIGNQK